jgi:diketogulonate reductase-like aldo/keto reductase
VRAQLNALLAAPTRPRTARAREGHVRVEFRYAGEDGAPRAQPLLVLTPADARAARITLPLNPEDSGREVGPFPAGAYDASLVAYAYRSEPAVVALQVGEGRSTTLGFRLAPQGVLAGTVAEPPRAIVRSSRSPSPAPACSARSFPSRAPIRCRATWPARTMPKTGTSGSSDSTKAPTSSPSAPRATIRTCAPSRDPGPLRLLQADRAHAFAVSVGAHRLGQGTWFMGDDPARRREEIAALREGIALGMTLIDTAEMYGDGRAESLVGEAIAGAREKAYLVTKVLPSNASRKGVARSCEASLERLKTDRVDCYLLHWMGSHPLEETVRGFEDLIAAGKIRLLGREQPRSVEMKKLAVGAGRRGLRDQPAPLQPHAARHRVRPAAVVQKRKIPVMAYSPVEQGRILDHKAI